MAYQKHVKFEDIEEEYPSNDSFCPDKSFIEAWENYLADEDLEEEMEAFRCARGPFMDLVVQGPLAAEWLRQQAHWYLWAAEQEDELSHLHSQSPSLTHEDKEVTSPSLSHQEVEDSDELNMPGEAEEDSGGAVSAPDDMSAWAQEDWDDFYESQVPSYLEEVAQEEPVAASENEEDFYRSYLPSYLEEVEQEVPDEAEEYVEDPTVLEEDDWAAFQSWQAPPDEARKEYAGPSRAVERGSSPPQQVLADRPPRVWSDGPTWEQVGGAPLRATPSSFLAGQQAAWSSRPGVPMDTSAGRTRMRTANTSALTGQQTVCHLCHDVGHIHSACPLKGKKITARPSKIQALQLRASRFRGQNPRNGGNVTDLQGPPSERTQMEKIRDLKSLARQYARDRGSCDDTRISYLEYVESEAEADWTLAQMIAG
jgi:hypothetical protein